jgi:hypothetical protein
LPRSLRSMVDAPNCGAEEKIGHSSRDDREERRKSQECRPFDFAQGKQEWLCHERVLAGRMPALPAGFAEEFGGGQPD